jgi:hypothetical protein
MKCCQVILALSLYFVIADCAYKLKPFEMEITDKTKIFADDELAKFDGQIVSGRRIASC